MQISHARIIATAASTIVLLGFALPAAAQVDLGMGQIQAIGLPTTDIRELVATFIRSVLGLLGIYFVLNIMWGGFLMMTHGGKEDKAAAAKAHIVNSVIGMVIIMTSSSFTKFVVNSIMNATSGEGYGL